MEQQLPSDSPYFLGPDYSVVDLYLTTVLAWHDDRDRLVRDCPGLDALVRRVQSRPAVKEAFDQHRMTVE